jgi:hypothetical protein
MRSRAITATGAALVAALLLGACGDDSNGTSTPASTTTLATAPERDRVDLAEPTFSRPTEITNPLFPISELTQVIQLGEEGGAAVRNEITLLPETKVVEWNGRQIETRVSQFVAYEERRIKEVAVDFFAQADDGAVWYFGEEVANYEDGAVADHEGTWLAGKDGPPGMIMPAVPEKGDVYRPENIPGLVFEEVTVSAVDQTVDGPRGPVTGAIVSRELLMDGTNEDKTFAPGYGEFSFEVPADEEDVDLALAVPTDALGEPVPAELTTILSSALDLDVDVVEVTNAAAAFATRPAPKALGAQLTAAVEALNRAVAEDDERAGQQAALDVARASLDLQLQYRPAAEVDVARLGVWARQAVLDSEGDAVGSVASDAVILEAIWQRTRHTVAADRQAAVTQQLADLRAAVDDEDLATAARAANALQASVG